MITVTDQTNQQISFKNIPKRIISLVPSQTEYLYSLGLEEEVIGITKFCIHPNEWFRNKTRVGGTKNLNLEQITILRPELIIANKEENVKAQIDELKKICPVYVSDVYNLHSALQMMYDVGVIVGKETKASSIVTEINELFQHLQPSTIRKAVYMIWRDPYMTVGGDTFISDMMQRCGFQNMFQNQNRYPEITIEQLREMNCELLLLSSEPYPFKEEHLLEIQAQLPNTKVILADGEMFSWYGSRLLQATGYFQSIMY
jgi:ABC-type Fe3+-hydroxamate transport system substrate-binding protein